MPEASTVRVTTSPPGVPNRQINSAIIRIRVWFDPRVYHALLIGKFPQIGRIMVDCAVFESNDPDFSKFFDLEHARDFSSFRTRSNNDWRKGADRKAV